MHAVEQLRLSFSLALLLTVLYMTHDITLFMVLGHDNKTVLDVMLYYHVKRQFLRCIMQSLNNCSTKYPAAESTLSIHIINIFQWFYQCGGLPSIKICVPGHLAMLLGES